MRSPGSMTSARARLRSFRPMTLQPRSLVAAKFAGEPVSTQVVTKPRIGLSEEPVQLVHAARVRSLEAVAVPVPGVDVEGARAAVRVGRSVDRRGDEDVPPRALQGVRERVLVELRELQPAVRQPPDDAPPQGA